MKQSTKRSLCVVLLIRRSSQGSGKLQIQTMTSRPAEKRLFESDDHGFIEKDYLFLIDKPER